MIPRFRLRDLAVNDATLRSRLDAKLTGIVGARNADEAARIHAFAERRGILAPPKTEFLKYRYQIDIDGNSNSWSLLMKLMMGSCVLKIASDWRQWYYERLRPWQHYVPTKSDMSDLDQKIRWCLDNDAAAEQIAEDGMKFANSLAFETEMRRAAVQLVAGSRPWTLGPWSRRL